VQRVAGLSAAVLLVLGIIVFIAIGAIKRERQALQRERELAAFAKTAAFEAGQSADEAKAAAARVVEANRDRLAQAARTEVALREKEQALQSSKAVLAMLSANQATTERLLEKLTPFIGEGSEALLTLAEELTQSISAAASLDPEIRLGQAGLHAVCSKLYLKLGKSEKALAQALEARRMVEELISRDPDSQTLKLRLFDFHLIVSEAFLRTRPQERPSTAAEQQRLMEPCETAVAVARTEALKVPSAGPWRSRYLTALSKTGQYLALFDRPQEAVERFQQAELFLSEHLKKTPDDRGLKQMLALLKDRLGNLFLSTGRISEAMEQFETALKIRKQGSGPTLSEDPEAQSDLATSYNKIGNVFLTQGDWEKALVYQQQSLGMREALCKQEPNPERMRDLGYTLNNVGKALWKLKRDDQAIGLFRKRYELMGKLMEEDSSDQSLRDYSNAVYAYADMLLNTRDAGLQDKPLSLELAAKAVKLNQRKEPRYLALLAQSQRLNGQTREARATAEEAFKLLPAEDNGSSELQETAREIAFELKRSKSPAADGTAAARTPKKKRR
jgi:tetratricopeptide (TPR) repeat protein